MQLSITTDYVRDQGDPEPYLRRIADAGITHLHWCHHWRSDFLYADSEIEQMARWFAEYGLFLNDVHGSEGVEKFWYSSKEYARLAGVELVKNRIDFAERLGANVVIMHIYPDTVEPALQPYNEIAWTQLRRSLDELQPYALERGVRIAAENLIDFPAVEAGAVSLAEASDNFGRIADLFELYPPEYLGVCYDPGHGNLGRDRMSELDRLKDRLIALHLNDNDGEGDQHRLLFSATVDWSRLAGIIATSGYPHKPMSMELSIHNSGIDNEVAFLREARKTGKEFVRMVNDQRT